MREKAAWRRKWLRPLGWIYGGASTLRNRMYDASPLSPRPGAPYIISVGNISTGGTGKTPLASYLLHQALGKGLRPAYLSRGYGRQTSGFYLVFPEPGSTGKYGDEATLIASRFPEIPVAVCENRDRGVHLLTQKHELDLIILDDAFQHRKVARHLDLVVIDANRLPQEDAMLPAGNLREPIQNLQRADFLIFNKLRNPASQVPEIRRLFEPYQKPMAFCFPELEQALPFHPEHPVLTQEALAGRAVVIFAGLGNNLYFFDQVEKMGLRLHRSFSYPDHFSFRKSHIFDMIRAWQGLAKADRPLLLTTEKDYHRLVGSLDNAIFQDFPFYFLPISLSWIAGEEQVQQLLPAPPMSASG
ncbi:MAG: tetraacyldisaccharide 4'-kinase [Bacteroidota bacterium]